VTRLGDVLADVKPGFATGDDLDDGVFQFRMHNFTRESALDLTKRRRVNATAKQLEMQSVAPGDVLFNATNSPELVGKSALIGELDEPAVFSNHFMRLRTDLTQLDPGYLAHFLRFQFGRGVFRAMAKAWVNQATIGRDRLEGLDIPLPPLPEQRRIATILDHADALGATRRQVLTHLDALTHSIFNDMFADARATSTVEAEASLIRTGPFGSQLLHSEFVEQGIAVLGLDNVVGNEFRWGERRFITPAKYEKLQRYTVSPGDVLISIMGTTGRCVVVPDDIPTAINTKHICAITPDSTHLDSTFLRAAFLWHPQSRAHLRRQTKGSIMDGLNMGIIKAMPIPVPPLSEQREFAERARQVIAVRDRTTSARNADDDLFASLQSRAFRGEL
jgi:type I restriction enzyme S subunit